MEKVSSYISKRSKVCESADDLLKEDTGRDATDKDLGVLGIDRGPLRVELVDDDVVALAFLLRTRAGEEHKVGLFTDTVLGMSSREAN